MNKTNKKLESHKKNKICNCPSCKDLRSLGRVDRVSRWVLGTVKWTYDYGYIIASGALSDKNHPIEKFNNLEETEKKNLINKCTKAYKHFKKYLLFYVCYLFGAYFQQCKRHNIQFKFEKDFLMIQLINFRKMIEKFYNKPNKKTTIWMPLFDNLFGKKDLNINKNFFLALFPPLKNEHLELIVDWFIEYKNDPTIESIFYSAAHYLYMELDENSSFYKVQKKGELMDSMLFKLTDKDFKGFDKSILQTESPIRFSFVFLALATHEKLKNLFKEYKTNEDFIEKIISIGPDINYQIES